MHMHKVVSRGIRIDETSCRLDFFAIFLICSKVPMSRISLSVVILTTSYYFFNVDSILIENGILGEPKVQCNGRYIGLNFTTINPFQGHVYVKGHYDNESCRTDATDSVVVGFRFPLVACGVRRERLAKPAGLSILTTIVVSFHPMFVTKLDRAFAVRCYFINAEKTLFADLLVRHNEIGLEHLGVLSDRQREASQGHLEGVTPLVIRQTVAMPTCRYEILQDNSVDSDPVKYATVGQLIYHKWSCKGAYDPYFCMTVHSCFVDDGNGNKFPLLNEIGCALDKYLMKNLNYSDDLTGGVLSHVFKYADKPSLFFQCQIRVTAKEGGSCQLSVEGMQAQAMRHVTIRNNGLQLIRYSHVHHGEPAFLQRSTENK